MKKRAKDGAPDGGLLARKKVKGGPEVDEDFGFDAKHQEKDISIEEDGEVSSEHSDKEIDVAAFAKFCKENPIGGPEASYDSAEDEDFDSQEDSEGNPHSSGSGDGGSGDGGSGSEGAESFDEDGDMGDMGGVIMSGKDLKEID